MRNKYYDLSAFCCLSALLLTLLLVMIAPMYAFASSYEVELIDEKGDDYVVDLETYDGELIMEDPDLIGEQDTTDEQNHNPTVAPTPVVTEVPLPTEPPMAMSNFEITIEHPTEWTNSDFVTVTIKVKDVAGTGWSDIEVKLDNSSWTSVADKMTNRNKAQINVMRNGLLTVRVTGEDGQCHTKDTHIDCFDETPPTVTAGIVDMLLHVETEDEQSGVAGIQVNGLLFTTLEDGMLDVRIKELLMEYEKLGVRAVDYAGNFSETVSLDNPYYIAPTTCPTATPKPTKKPESGSQSGADSGNTGSGITNVPTATPSNGQNLDINSLLQSGMLNITAPVLTPEPEVQYIPLGPGQPYMSGGNMQTLDMLYSAATNKQFISVQTKAGETYYLIIDYDKPIDEDAEIYETYFLNLVDDSDLISVVGEEAMATPSPSPTPVVVYVTPEPSMQPTVDVPTKNGSTSGSTFVLLLALIGGGIAIWYFKFRGNGGKGKQMQMMDEFDDFEEPERTEPEE